MSFEEAKTVFNDKNALFDYDNNHSLDEDRFRILGESDKVYVMLVIHCVRQNDIIRIISARNATKKERDYYIKGRID